MKILVTGGAGFLASHIADALVAAGHAVHVLDDLSAGRRDQVPAGAVFHEMDIRASEMEALWEEERFEVLFHYAAQIAVRVSIDDPCLDADVNVNGLLNVLEAGRKNGLQRVIFPSSGGAVYGEPHYAPQDERHHVDPLSPYGIAKRTAEYYLRYYRRRYGLSFVALRYSNVYGPRQNPFSAAGVIAILCEMLLAGQPPQLFGDGEQTRDFLYVADAVRANLAVLERDVSGIFNVGTGIETPLKVVVQQLKEHLNPSAQVDVRPARSGEQLRSVISNRRMLESFGWTPEVPLADGLQKTADWFQTQYIPTK